MEPLGRVFATRLRKDEKYPPRVSGSITVRTNIGIHRFRGLGFSITISLYGQLF